MQLQQKKAEAAVWLLVTNSGFELAEFHTQAQREKDTHSNCNQLTVPNCNHIYNPFKTLGSIFVGTTNIKIMKKNNISFRK